MVKWRNSISIISVRENKFRFWQTFFGKLDFNNSNKIAGELVSTCFPWKSRHQNPIASLCRQAWWREWYPVMLLSNRNRARKLWQLLDKEFWSYSNWYVYCAWFKLKFVPCDSFCFLTAHSWHHHVIAAVWRDWTKVDVLFSHASFGGGRQIFCRRIKISLLKCASKKSTHWQWKYFRW